MGDSESAIMEATFTAVCQHGYAALTMQDIADEFDKSKSLLHYHYDTKEQLFVAFLEHLVDRFEDNLADLLEQASSPADRLQEFIDWFTLADDDRDRRSLHLALLELRSQASRNERFRAQFARSDRIARGALQALIEEGQDEGIFRNDVDAEELAQVCFVAMDGARARQITLGEDGYAMQVGQTLFHLVTTDQGQGAR